jgi:hypothetical protein
MPYKRSLYIQNSLLEADSDEDILLMVSLFEFV